jgi:protein translocase SecG subunit
MIYNILIALMLISAVLVVASILLQQKGTGLSGVFGGSDVSYLTRRGAEKFLTIFTIAMIVVFVASSLGLLIIK